VRACVEAGALAAGCDWGLTETSPRYAEFSNDEQLARLFAANWAALGRDMDLTESGPRGMATAATDMGNVSQPPIPSLRVIRQAKAPGVFI
jgi:hypothetical protein